MLQTAHNTMVVSSTDLKRKYQEVKKMLENHMMVIVTNRNSQDKVDGIFIPYSEQLIEHLEDLLEDLEIKLNKATLEKEFASSLKSGKGKRIALDRI